MSGERSWRCCLILPGCTAADGLDIDINEIIFHRTEGSYPSVVNHFQNPQAYVSSHYFTRSTDGYIVQMVRNNDVAWHLKMKPWR
ncbi:MAG: N-acetylmuramoyl-L-alanine amidase [Chloroflexaceae bacterium]